MIDFHRFTKFDWDGYAGAETLADGTNPFMGSIDIEIAGTTLTGCDVIVSDTGIDIYANEYWFKLKEGKEASSAAILLRLNPKMTDEELQSLGFSVLVE